MSLTFRSARPADLPVLVGMLADDPLGATREAPGEPLDEAYHSAFAAIRADSNNEIVVAERESTIAGFLQLTFIPNLTHRGAWRAQIEGVRVRTDLRGEGVGAELVEHAIARARERGCSLVQLTTDRLRADAIRFYRGLGFAATHEGLKLHLDRRKRPGGRDNLHPEDSERDVGGD